MRAARRGAILVALAGLLNACSTNTPSTQPAIKASTAYRQDAAKHLYASNTNRIYHGKLPPLLYAIAVLQLDIDGNGRITQLHWLRKPAHAPEAVAAIEQIARAAAPYPIPSGQTPVRYTDTWLWEESGKFQLDTLSEGQLTE